MKNITNAESILREILACYSEILCISETVSINASSDCIGRFIKRRTSVFRKIEEKRSCLTFKGDFNILSRVSPVFEEICTDIKNIITEVIVLDQSIMKRVNKRMSDIKKELKLSSQRSKAVLSYARNS